MDDTNPDVPTPPYDDPRVYKYGGELATAQAGSLDTHMLRNPPVRKIIQARLAETERLAQAYRDALAALDENPSTEKLLDTLRKLGI